MRAGLPWWCVASAGLAHLALLGSGAQALDNWKRQQALIQPSATPAAIKVRAVTAPQPAEPLPAPAWSPGLVAAPGQDIPPLAPAALTPVPPASTGTEPALYMPRTLLTVAPVALTPVMLQWPPSWRARRSFAGVLKLYLDEQGRVDRVEPDGDPELPPALFEAARQAFLAAEFSPGQFHGLAVKAWMRVEVKFEAETLLPPP